jgi:predicted Zn-dependent peptidase
MTRARRFSVKLFCILFSATALLAQDIASFEKRITVKKLPNGLTVMVMERHEAPVFSFHIQVDAGSAQDPKGLSGLAHMFEHMAFKGTPTIGGKPGTWPQEKQVLEELEKAYLAYDAEERKIIRNEAKVRQLETHWRELAKKADAYVEVNEFGQLVDAHGGVGLNASTFNDETTYYYSMPANQFELWAFLESERFLHPVYREFYKERDVVLEERRMRTDSSPIGRLIEQFLAAAYTAHPYQTSGVGWYSEISSVTATDAAEFYKTYYTPANIVLAVVGDLKTADALATIERYFGRLPKGDKPLELRTVEPKQIAERTVTLREAGQPWYLEGYHRPGYNDKDDAVYDAITDLLSNGRTSRLYRSLVRDKKIAANAGGFSGFPGNKYPHLFLFFAVPTQGNTPEVLANGIHEEIEKLKKQDITDEELKMIKTRAKASLLRSLDDNQGLAIQLTMMQTRYGDWRELFRNVERIEKVTKADIRRVATSTFVPNNRTVGVIENVQTATAKEGGTQ